MTRDLQLNNNDEYVLGLKQLNTVNNAEYMLGLKSTN